MSDLYLPPRLQEVLKPITPVDAPAVDEPDDRKARSLPEPTGWKVLCIVPEVADTFDGTSLVRPDTHIRAEEHATTVLFVAKIGPEAYKDPVKFPNGPWCKEGDFVLVRTYSGTRFRVFGKEMRLLNDDQIEAVIEDPRGVTRV